MLTLRPLYYMKKTLQFQDNVARITQILIGPTSLRLVRYEWYSVTLFDVSSSGEGGQR